NDHERGTRVDARGGPTPAASATRDTRRVGPRSGDTGGNRHCIAMATRPSQWHLTHRDLELRLPRADPPHALHRRILCGPHHRLVRLDPPPPAARAPSGRAVSRAPP